MNRQGKLVDAAACKNTIPKPPHGTAAGDAGKHVRRQGKPHRKPSGHGGGINAMRIRRAKHRHEAGGDQAKLLRRGQATVMPVPSVDPEQPVRVRRPAVKRQPVRHVAHRVKAEINPNSRGVRAGRRKQPVIMRPGRRAGFEADRDRRQHHALKLRDEGILVGVRQHQPGGAAHQRVQDLGIFHVCRHRLDNPPSLDRPAGSIHRQKRRRRLAPWRHGIESIRDKSVLVEPVEAFDRRALEEPCDHSGPLRHVGSVEIRSFRQHVHRFQSHPRRAIVPAECRQAKTVRG